MIVFKACVNRFHCVELRKSRDSSKSFQNLPLKVRYITANCFYTTSMDHSNMFGQKRAQYFSRGGHCGPCPCPLGKKTTGKLFVVL